MAAWDESLAQWLATCVEEGPRPLFATLSGAHLYGFESPDSDFDLRGAYVEPVESLLRLRPARETIDVTQQRDGRELDWVAHDLRKFVSLMTKRNGYVLEQLYSPLVVVGGDHYDELRRLAQGCIVKPLYHHYAGFARNQRRLLDGGEETVKRLLYCYRVLLTGIHVLATGRIESNLHVLQEEYGVDGVTDLIARKRAGAEYAALDHGEAREHATALDLWSSRLEAEHDRCRLPEAVEHFDALDDFVVRARLELCSE